MMRIMFLLAALAAPAASVAAPYVYTTSGDQFVKMMGMLTASPKDDYAYLQREKAYSYLDGARDGVEGVAWCDVHQLKTPDLAYDLADEIAKLPAAERKKNASVLLREILGRKYPCRAKEAKR
jgi:hypothetical protein